MEEFLKSDLFNWGILPILIFCSRVMDVSMGTVRVILIARGVKIVAAAVGFFEVLVWLVAIGQILARMTNPLCYLAYGLGFSTGTYVGMTIEGRLRIGQVVIRVITAKAATGLIERLHALDYGVTSLDAQGSGGPVKLIFSVIQRRDLREVVNVIHEFDPSAFYTVGDVRYVSEGIFPNSSPRQSALPRLLRKGK